MNPDDETKPGGERPGPGAGLGRSVAQRWATPGPRTRARPGPLGSVGHAALRFSAGLGRSPQVRRQLAGPAPIRPVGSPQLVRPPLWWRPGEHGSDPVWGAAPRTGASEPVPDRQLRRAAGRVPSLTGHQPGSAGTAMKGKPVKVRRVPDVQFSGQMKGAAAKLVPPRSGRGTTAGHPAGTAAGGPEPRSGSGAGRGGQRDSPGSVGPPGPGPGDGGSHLRAARAVPRSAVGSAPATGVGIRRAASGAAQAGREVRPTGPTSGYSDSSRSGQPGPRARWAGVAVGRTGSGSAPAESASGRQNSSSGSAGSASVGAAAALGRPGSAGSASGRAGSASVGAAAVRGRAGSTAGQAASASVGAAAVRGRAGSTAGQAASAGTVSRSPTRSGSPAGPGSVDPRGGWSGRVGSSVGAAGLPAARPSAGPAGLPSGASAASGPAYPASRSGLDGRYDPAGLALAPDTGNHRCSSRCRHEAESGSTGRTGPPDGTGRPGKPAAAEPDGTTGHRIGCRANRRRSTATTPDHAATGIVHDPPAGGPTGRHFCCARRAGGLHGTAKQQCAADSTDQSAPA